MTRTATWLPAVLALHLSCATIFGAASPAPTTQPGGEQLRPILSPEAKQAAGRALVDRFVRHLQSSPQFTDSARQAVADAWDRHRGDDQPHDFLAAALAMLSRPFNSGLEAMDREDYAEAGRMLRPLLNDPDPWLNLHAAAALARALVEQDRTDDAEPLLAGLADRRADLADKSFLEVEVDFLLGYCQLANLRYDQAAATLERFERDHPDAPEKYRLPARQMLAELEARNPRSLGEVSDLMTFAGRRLIRRLTDQPVRDAQQRAVDLLAELIHQAEQREKQQQQASAGGSGSGRGGRQIGGTPQSPAPQSMLPAGQSETGPLQPTPNARPGEAWGRMQPEERQRILQSLQQRFPSRYRQLVEQYYRQLAKEP